MNRSSRKKNTQYDFNVHMIVLNQTISSRIQLSRGAFTGVSCSPHQQAGQHRQGKDHSC